MICPSCKGFGCHFGFLVPVRLNCELCFGSGIINEDSKKLLWIEQGKFLREYRLNTLKLTLRGACKKYDIDPAYLSKMERGIIKPSNIYANKKDWLTNIFYSKVDQVELYECEKCKEEKTFDEMASKTECVDCFQKSIDEVI